MKQISTLIHHIKLNESGWWEKAIQNIIISSFGIKENCPLNKDQSFQIIKDEIDGGLDQFRFNKQFDILISSQAIIPSVNSTFILSEAKFDEFKLIFQEQKDLELDAEKFFTSFVKLYCENIDPFLLWLEFKSELLYPLIKEIGAKTYELISGKRSLSIEEYKTYFQFTKKYNGQQTNINRVILDFLNFENIVVRKFILKLLNEYFFIEATNLDEATIQGIYDNSNTQANLKVYVDTNFLLTLLDLHDNPSNEATTALLDLLQEIKNKVNVKFYILPNTISEFQNLILKFKDYIKRIRPTLAYAAAVEESTEFSGIIKRYFEKCNEKKVVLDPDEYFDPFINNFSVYYRKKGLELQNENIQKYVTDQRVIDDVLEQTDYRLNKLIKTERLKGLSEPEIQLIKDRIYDRFNHDCQIWHIVKDKRPQYVDSPKDIVQWILTLDFSFLEYDKFKQSIDPTHKISLCLHPNELISMMQFWVPRSIKFEKAILGSLRLPFLFKEIDSESERISIEILRTLSQYEDHDSYSKELVTEILTNRALRQKIKPSNSVQRNAELIKEEVFRKLDETNRKLAAEKNKSFDLENKLNSFESTVQSLSNKVDILIEKRTSEIEDNLERIRKEAIVEVENKKADIQSKINQLEIRIADLDEYKSKADEQIKKQKNALSTQILYLFSSSDSINERLKQKIYPKYFNEQKYLGLISEKKGLCVKLESMQAFNLEENVIVFCENQNSGLFNQLGFKKLRFIPENNSAGVFIKIMANPDKFGVRDRDYLTDNEIYKLKQKFSNYFILDYYCFENYLYHPDNLEELNIQLFDKIEYIRELIKRKNENRDSIISIYKKSRDTYQEFKVDSDKIRDKNDQEVISNLKSDDIEVFFKSFSMKDCDKSYLTKYNIKPVELISTQWFRERIADIFERLKK
jgi:hypothetical protein